MAVEPAVFVGQQGFEVVGRDLLVADRVAPHAIGVGKAPHWRAVLGQDDASQIVPGQWQRPESVGQPEEGDQQHDRARQPLECSWQAQKKFRFQRKEPL